eukprot:gene20061-biopygen16095
MGFSHPPPRGRGLHLVAGRFAPGHYAFWLVVRSSSGVPPKIGSGGWGRGGVPGGVIGVTKAPPAGRGGGVSPTFFEVPRGATNGAVDPCRRHPPPAPLPRTPGDPPRLLHAPPPG